MTYDGLSSTSNDLANYNNLYNIPDIYTKTETSNIFVTSNVLSNTSNILANYYNLYNKPTIFTQQYLRYLIRHLKLQIYLMFLVE